MVDCFRHCMSRMTVIRMQPASNVVPPNRKQLVYEPVLSFRAPENHPSIHQVYCIQSVHSYNYIQKEEKEI